MAASNSGLEEEKSDLTGASDSLQARFSLRKPKITGKTSEDRDISPSTRLYEAYLAWKESQGIPKDVKMYTVVSGQYPDVHHALQSRGDFHSGYLENKEEETGFYDFRWSTKSKLPEKLGNWQVVNHFPEISHVSTKMKFAKHLKEYLGRECDRVFPRTYVVKGWDSFADFDLDYKLTQTRSILKLFSAGHPVSLPKVHLSLLISRQFIDSPSHSPPLPDSFWKVIKSITPEITLKLYSQLNLGEMPSQDVLLSETNAILAVLKSILPQFEMDGDRNVWIIKPGGKSRGREISLHSGLEEIKRRINVKQAWIIQKYIENPLLIHNHKFDIRQWVLLTSLRPLTLWFYDACYLRFSADTYNIEEIDNKFSHLTNNSVVKYAENFGNSREFEGCMWSCQQFEEYLEELVGEKEVFSTKIRPKIEEILKNAILSVQNAVIHRENSFELLGFDLMVDRDLQPWLLEGNTSPAMDYSTPVTEVLVKQVLEDTVKVVEGRGGLTADTGKFRVILEEGRTSQ